MSALTHDGYKCTEHPDGTYKVSGVSGVTIGILEKSETGWIGFDLRTRSGGGRLTTDPFPTAAEAFRSLLLRGGWVTPSDDVQS